MASEPDGVQNQSDLHSLFSQVMSLVKSEIDVSDEKGHPRYTDVCEWFAEKIHSTELLSEQTQVYQRLLAQCCDVLGLDKEDFLDAAVYQSTSPASFSTGTGPNKELTRFSLRLWQLGAHEISHVKGAPPLHGVRDCLQRFLTSTGCETAKFPLEILFQWPNQWEKQQSTQSSRPGSPLGSFVVAISIGSSVTMACHMLCWAAAKLDWLAGDLLADDVKTDVAERLLKCICSLVPFTHISLDGA